MNNPASGVNGSFSHWRVRALEAPTFRCGEYVTYSEERCDADIPRDCLHWQLLYVDNFDGAWGIPDSLRQKFILNGLGETSIVLDACYTTGLSPGDRFATAGITANAALVRAGLKNFFTQEPIKTGRRGRRHIRYTMPSFRPLLEDYGIALFGDSSVIEPEDLTNMKTYRQAVYRNFIREKGRSQWSRKKLSSLIGVSPRTLRSYEKEIPGMEVTPNYSRRTISHYVNFVDLARDLDEETSHRYWLEIAPEYDQSRMFRAPAKSVIAIMWYNRGAEITVVEQLTNTYYVPPLAWPPHYREIPF